MTFRVQRSTLAQPSHLIPDASGGYSGAQVLCVSLHGSPG